MKAGELESVSGQQGMILQDAKFEGFTAICSQTEICNQQALTCSWKPLFLWFMEALPLKAALVLDRSQGKHCNHYDSMTLSQH